MKWRRASTVLCSSVWRISASSISMPGRGQVAEQLADHVVVARFLEIGADHILGIGVRLGLGQAHLLRRPLAEQPVAPRRDLELHLLVAGVHGFERLLAVIELAHGDPCCWCCLRAEIGGAPAGATPPGHPSPKGPCPGARICQGAPVFRRIDRCSVTPLSPPSASPPSRPSRRTRPRPRRPLRPARRRKS